MSASQAHEVPVVPVKKSIDKYGKDKDDFDVEAAAEKIGSVSVVNETAKKAASKNGSSASSSSVQLGNSIRPANPTADPTAKKLVTPVSALGAKNGAASSSSDRLATPGETAAPVTRPLVPISARTGPMLLEKEEKFEESEESESEAEQNSEEPKKEEKENIVQLPGFVESTKKNGTKDEKLFVVEMVADENDNLLFAANEFKNTVPNLERWKDKTRVKTIPPLALKSFVEPDPAGGRSLRLPSKAQRGFTAEQLIGEIKAFIKRWADMPEEWITPIATYVLMTWVYDRFTVVPYLRFLGEIDTGKTRIAQVAAALSYRSLTASGNITGASLFHSIDLIRGTVFLDEADFKNSDEQSDIIKILNNGHMAGLSVMRNQTEGKKWVPVRYVVYGPKIITTRGRWDDSATESRCLTFETQERKVPAHIPLQLNEKFELDSLTLRNKLLGWRFDNFEKIKADDSMLRKAGLKTRMAQMGTSLLAVAPESEKAAIVSFLKGYAEGAKGDSHKEVVRQILEEAFAPHAPQRGPTGDVRDSFGVGDDDIFDKEGEVSIKRLTEITNQRLEGSGSNQLTHKTIGGLVRSLGYLTRRKMAGYIVERKGG